jgi:P pilus assembly chaperone PapD
LIRRFLKNKKGVAEVIGSVMFLVILLFFFTNVYLWHDAATKEMNDLQIQKINTKIDASITPAGILQVTNNGAMDVSLATLWVNEKSTPGSPDTMHRSFDLNNAVVVGGGSSVTIPIPYSTPTGRTVIFKVITATGTIEPCPIIP